MAVAKPARASRARHDNPVTVRLRDEEYSELLLEADRLDVSALAILRHALGLRLRDNDGVEDVA